MNQQEKQALYLMSMSTTVKEITDCCENRKLTGQYNNLLGIHLECANCGATFLELGGE